MSLQESGSSPSPKSKASPRRYSDKELRDIGKTCGNTLPPASAVQSMFLYEMQRQTEAEKLFHGQMFELARVQGSTAQQESRITNVEDSMTRLKAQMMDKDIEERLSTSKTRTDHLESKIKQLSSSLEKQANTLTEAMASQAVTAEKVGKLDQKIFEPKSLESWSETISSKLDNTIFQQHEHATAIEQHESHLSSLSDLVSSVATMLKYTDENCKANTSELHARVTTATAAATTAASSVPPDVIGSLQSKLATCDTEIGVLFDERDATAVQLQLANDRIEKLEDLVRVLTLQASPTTSSSSSPALAQVLPVVTKDGQLLNLCVPKGKPLVSFVANQRSSSRFSGTGGGSGVSML